MIGKMRNADRPVVVILAAGLGTRMKSAKAKVLHQAGGKTLIEHVVDTALRLTAPERVLVVVGHQAEAVREKVAGRGVRFAWQAEQKGTGHALLCARSQLDACGEPLLVLYGDCPLISEPTLRRLLEAQAETAAAGTVLTTILEDPSGYGRILRGPDGGVAAIVEHKAADPEQLAIREINSGIYCFRPEPFWRALDRVRPHPASGEYYLTDVIEELRADGERVAALTAPESGEVLGINNRIELAAVDRLLRERKVRELMAEGVTIEKPETATVDAEVQVGMDSVLEPFVQLRGRTVVGPNCRIGAASILEDTVVEQGAEILPFCVVASSTIGAGSRIGPFTRIRPGTVIAEGAHAGNFVELKNTRLGKGSKANHLAYLGDAEIGAGVNIGAGTITCNYDGEKKHRTTIADRAFVGSNSTLVAPVALGADCYVGAGSVVTHPVPPEALAVGRSRQVNKEGWRRKRRAANLADAPPNS
jgi:bifunctional UDP-N-acetylglucosamine pyrophosphorylase/glucosamine-1-phosphate N-acetyltransferase